MTKYDRVFKWFSAVSRNELCISIAGMELVQGFPMPKSARRHRAWWANQRGTGTHVQSRAWLDAGFEVKRADLARELIIFGRRAQQ